MRSFFKWVFVIIPVMLILIAVGAGVWLYNQYNEYQETPIALNEDSMVFEVAKGSSVRKVANQLAEQNLFKPAMGFEALARHKNLHGKIKAGEYTLEKGMKPMDVLQKLVDGKSVQYKATIPEGKTFKEMIKSVRASKDLVHTLKDEDIDNIMTLIGSDEKSPEGWFYPDTYFFPRNTTDIDFLKRAHQQMKDYLQKAWDGRQVESSLKGPYDALRLASIVEKETGAPEDRVKIARVFINRLDKKMMLQTDPTVIYGMGDRYKGNIRKKDLKRDTPYNTYTRHGLTPTPIAIPSKAAIDAVMHPADGDMLYFVAKGDGTSHFSKTYREHRKAVIKYLLGGNAKRYKGGN